MKPLSKTVNRSSEPPGPNLLMQRVAKAMETRGLEIKAAARLIGVTPNTLQNHLRGEHVRSDSATKYETWLAGRSVNQKVFVFPRREAFADSHPEDVADDSMPPVPARPYLVVDIFSGCGGLSLGFDLLGGGGYFQTILALDNQLAPIQVLNRNAATLGHRGRPVGRQVDLTEFMNEAEFLAFYVGHAAAQHDDQVTLNRLDALSAGAFVAFRAQVAATDAAYIADLTEARSLAKWRDACDGLDKQALNQTSVVGFHDKLKLPRTGARPPGMPNVLWGDVTPKERAKAPKPQAAMLTEAEWEITAEVSALRAKRESSGRGQLTASARRVRAFVDFLESPAFAPVRTAWTCWRARRIGLRAALFTNEQFSREVRDLYATSYPVGALVGGPPCQGFSRIGRGKIRSLREAMVHVQGDAEAGDARNLLFRQYLMVLGALRPPVFLFENVQHFQSIVKAGGVEFEATEVLAEAIANMSDAKASYGVSSRVIDASRHGIPQTRQRFFMCGVLRQGERSNDLKSVAEISAATCLKLPRLAEVPLSAALAGLPEPEFVGGDTGGSDAIGRPACLGGMLSGNGATGRYTAWIRQPAPGCATAPVEADGHAARAARSDDAAFFALMGPGKRWMDYRADDAPTVAALQEVLSALVGLPSAALAAAQRAALTAGHTIPNHADLQDLLSSVNGSLPIRLLLEQAGEKLGTSHHLLTQNYLAKRDGHHGDWVARLDAARPAKTIVSHMGKDTYGYIHPSVPRTISVREAARVQAFPDWFSFGGVALTDAFKMVGNAVPPLLSFAIAGRVARVMATHNTLSLPVPPVIESRSPKIAVR